jgi:membrane-bound serine protease (ClpP class)
VERLEALLADPYCSLLFIGAGILFLFLEIFIPTGGVLGILSVGSMIFGIYGLFHQGHPILGVVAILICAGLSAAGVRFGLRRLSFATTLAQATATSTSTGSGASSLVGQRGVTQTALRPAGVAKIAGGKVDVVTEGSYVEAGVEVEVIDSSANRVVVRALLQPATGSKAPPVEDGRAPQDAQDKNRSEGNPT